MRLLPRPVRSFVGRHGRSVLWSTRSSSHHVAMLLDGCTDVQCLRDLRLVQHMQLLSHLRVSALVWLRIRLASDVWLQRSNGRDADGRRHHDAIRADDDSRRQRECWPIEKSAGEETSNRVVLLGGPIFSCRLRPFRARPETPSVGCRPNRSTSCVSCLPFAFPTACAFG